MPDFATDHWGEMVRPGSQIMGVALGVPLSFERGDPCAQMFESLCEMLADILLLVLAGLVQQLVQSFAVLGTMALVLIEESCELVQDDFDGVSHGAVLGRRRALHPVPTALLSLLIYVVTRYGSNDSLARLRRSSRAG
ncbi:MAG TPA: hypothetical protein VIO94_15500 [Phenylobacterium sp.]